MHVRMYVHTYVRMCVRAVRYYRLVSILPGIVIPIGYQTTLSFGNIGIDYAT